MTSCVVVMPAFDEADGITGFLTEILDAFESVHVSIRIIDDCSSDGTAHGVAELASRGLPVHVTSNRANLGHGPSTVAALREGLASGAEVVVTVDGDGQFLGRDIAAVARAVVPGGRMVVEGVRTVRSDPLYRRVVSLGTRALVRVACGVTPEDANTPLRGYPREVLNGLLSRLPSEPMVPNLMISALTRADGIRVLQIPVRSMPRRGASTVGTSWGGIGRMLPSRRFIRFCRAAITDWRAFRATSS